MAAENAKQLPPMNEDETFKSSASPLKHTTIEIRQDEESSSDKPWLSRPQNRSATQESPGRGLDSEHSNEVEKPDEGDFSISRALRNADSAEARDLVRQMAPMFATAQGCPDENPWTRPKGVVFRDLTVRGRGIGADFLPTVSQSLLRILRTISMVLRRGPKAARDKSATQELLSHFDGCVRPGELLLVLGPPGAGCTTFLKAFCGQFGGFEEVTGVLSHGGEELQNSRKGCNAGVTFAAEGELHYVRLSVRRTLNFATGLQAPRKELKREKMQLASFQKKFVEVLAKIFGIESTLEQMIGNELIQGISGGERRRVSIAEAMATRSAIQAWDNPGVGLDAGNVLRLIRTFRCEADLAGASIALSLHQTSERCFKLMDKVLLIGEGKCLYMGPSKDAKSYFVDMGFQCPENSTTPEFLNSISSQVQRSVRAGFENKVPQTVDELAERYKRSDMHAKTVRDVECLERLSVQLSQAEVDDGQSRYRAPFQHQILACFKRRIHLIRSDRDALLGKWSAFVALSLLVGGLLFNLPKAASTATARAATLFLLLSINSFTALVENTNNFDDMAIVLKHQGLAFYRPAAFALGQTLVELPLLAAQILILTVPIYFMSNLAKDLSKFILAILMTWLHTLVVYVFFRLLSAWCRSNNEAIKYECFAVQALLIFIGYGTPFSHIPPWLRWIRWLSWPQYSLEGLLANELKGMALQCDSPYLVPNSPRVSSEFQTCALQGGGVPGLKSVRGEDFLEASYPFNHTHIWRNVGILCVFYVGFVLAYVVTMEFCSTDVKGERKTIWLRNKAPNKLRAFVDAGGRYSNKDEENGTTYITSASWKAKPSAEETSRKTTVARIARQEFVLSFRGLAYTVKHHGKDRQLLQGIQGFIRPGKLTALIGASGAGKTTLLSVMAQQTRAGVVSGGLYLDGHSLPRSFAREVGLAQQLDTHEPTATVREALEFSAALRQGSENSAAEGSRYCDLVLDIIGMSDMADAVIGNPTEGLTKEQRKRLTIGIEIASKPKHLLLTDEPTSGLDSVAAFDILSMLRGLADEGQTILCTIHQPSALLFSFFDEVMLLGPGGKLLYLGPLGEGGRILLDYLHSNGAPPCPPEANPADFVLEVTEAHSPPQQKKDWGAIWADSPECAARDHEVEELNAERRPGRRRKQDAKDAEYASTLSHQTLVLLKRNFITNWRSPSYLWGKLLLHIASGMLNGFSFWQLGHSIANFKAASFSVIDFLCILLLVCLLTQSEFFHFRALFQAREDKVKTYSWAAWCLATILVEIPHTVIRSISYFCCWWWAAFGTQRTTSSSAFALLTVIAAEVYFVSLGQFIAAMAPNRVLASLLISILFVLFLCASGGLQLPSLMPSALRDTLNKLTPLHYIFEALFAAATEGQPLQCAEEELIVLRHPTGMTCREYVDPYIVGEKAGGYVSNASAGQCLFCQYASGQEYAMQFNIQPDKKWRAFGIVWAFTACTYVLILFFTWLYFKGYDRARRSVRRLRKNRGSVL